MDDWNFSVRWLDEEHVLLTFTKGEVEHNIALPVYNYAEFMEVAHTFNNHFRSKIDQGIVKHYVKP